VYHGFALTLDSGRRADGDPIANGGGSDRSTPV
jgi:hypothetical protein